MEMVLMAFSINTLPFCVSGIVKEFFLGLRSICSTTLMGLMNMGNMALVKRVISWRFCLSSGAKQKK